MCAYLILVSRQAALADNQQGLLLKANKQTYLGRISSWLSLSRLPALSDTTTGGKGTSDPHRRPSRGAELGILPKVQANTDATQLLGLGRLAGPCHADLAEANQNFTHGVSVPGQDCCASGKALLILGPAVGKPNAEVWCLQGVLELCEGRTVEDDVGISSNKMKALGYHFKEKMPTRLRQCSLAE